MGHGSTRMHTDKYNFYRLRRANPYGKQTSFYSIGFCRRQAALNNQCLSVKIRVRKDIK